MINALNDQLLILNACWLSMVTNMEPIHLIRQRAAAALRTAGASTWRRPERVADVSDGYHPQSQPKRLFFDVGLTQSKNIVMI